MKNNSSKFKILNSKQTSLFGFSQNVLVLSVVSFLNDIGGETIKRTIPLFLTNVLAVPTGIVGIVEGVGEAMPRLFQPLSGYFSDRMRKRKSLVVIGQIFRSSMAFLFFATSWVHVLLIRFLDRSGKGITTAPKDALVAASTDSRKEGRAFGLNRALDNAGAVVGLTIAGFITLSLWSERLPLTAQAFQRIVLLAVIPLISALILIIFFVRDVGDGKNKGYRVNFRLMNYPKFAAFLAVSFFFTLGNSSDAFLILRSQGIGLPVPAIFFLLAAMSVVASITDLPAGIASDHHGRKKLLTWGWLLYSFIYLGFAYVSSAFAIVLLFLGYGLYYGLTEGAGRALVADLVPSEWHGTAFGLYHVTVGITLLPASVLAGILWQAFSPSAAFLFGSLMSLLAVVSLQLVLPKTVIS